MRSLKADGFRRPALGILLVMALLGAWFAWFTLSRVTLYEVSQSARLEVSQSVYPLEAQVSGRIVSVNLKLGQEVKEGEILLEIDARTRIFQLKEERVRRAGAESQLIALNSEIVLAEEALGSGGKASKIEVREAKADLKGVYASLKRARTELERKQKLRESGSISQQELDDAEALVEELEAKSGGLDLAIKRVGVESKGQSSSGRAGLESLKRQQAELVSAALISAATIERLEYEIERTRVRAPVTGRIGQMSSLKIGEILVEGQKLATIVPYGDLKIGAQFVPQSALGRVKPGQTARLRLDGFPWIQYGSVPARVDKVATESLDGFVRVELTLVPTPGLAIPMEHGLPGSVEIEVEEVSPAVLVLRAAGKLIAAPAEAAPETAAAQGEQAPRATAGGY
jgi:multidrug resistance efflux pump